MRSALEIENKQLVKVTEDLKNLILKLEGRVAVLEGGKGAAPVAAKKVTTSWGQGCGSGFFRRSGSILKYLLYFT